MNANAIRKPQLTSDELHQVKWLLGGLLTLLGVGTVFYMDVQAWTLMTLTAVATIAAMFWPTLPSRLPRAVHTLAFPAIVVFFAGDLWLRAEILPAMVRLDILLLLYRSLSYRQRRDDLQIVILGLFLIVVAGVLTVSLTFAAHLLVYTASALAMLLVITLTDTPVKKGEKPPPPNEAPGWVAHVRWGELFRRLGQVTDWRVLGLGAVLFAGVVAVSSLLFLAIPRFQLENSMFLDRLITKKAKSGFADSIRFGDVTDIQQDTSVALSVDVSDQSGIPAAPYWRMVVLDHYENGTFRLSPSLRRQEFEAERTQPFVHGRARLRGGNGIVWTFYLESGVSRYLPLLGPFGSVRFREAQSFSYAPHLGVLGLREEPAAMTAYRVEGFDLSNALPDPRFAERWKTRHEPAAGRPVLQWRLALGEADRNTLARLVTEATGGRTLPAAEFALQVGAWLQRNHPYSLSPVVPRTDGDPLVAWAASREGGHCELFAGAFVVMARTAGFAARVVTGFRGGSWNGYSNNFTIRNSDAHAWAEIFDEKAGVWLRADPLAPEAASSTQAALGEAALAARMDRSWKARLDSLRVFWYRRIVSFDQRSQVETLKAVKEATQASGKRLREWAEAFVAELKAWLLSPWDLTRAASVAGVFVVFGSLAWAWRTYARPWWRSRIRSGTRREDPVRREASTWLAKLSDARADEGGQGVQVRAALERIRFGARETWPVPEATFREARHALRAARREARATRT
jgi:transglutaminase-like putative cysteine protease